MVAKRLVGALVAGVVAMVVPAMASAAIDQTTAVSVSVLMAYTPIKPGVAYTPIKPGVAYTPIKPGIA